MNRRWPSVLALTTILGSGALVVGTTAPAAAGPPFKYDVYHSLAPSGWELVSYDCSGAVDDGSALKLGSFAQHRRGSGSLRVRSDASYGGALLRSDRPGLSSLVYPTYATGAAPTGSWRVEVGDHVLVSDPVPLAPGDWSVAAIEGVVLNEGTWSGTTDDFQAEFGVAEKYTAGLMTGGCLGSPTAYVDTVTRQRDHKIVRDLESGLWARLDHGANSYAPQYGTLFGLRTKLLDEDITGTPRTGVANARMALWRRYLHRGWERVLTRTTDDRGVARAEVRAGPSARYQWRWVGHAVASAPELIATSSSDSEPRVG
jgi:hypothetical protein